MPEGHTIHRIAREHRGLLVGEQLRLSSPQGRFALAAATLDGARLDDVEPHGKHLFYDFGAGRVVHVHLGIYGTFTHHPQPAPEPRGALRWRLETPTLAVDLRGPTTCELVGPAERDRVRARLGPDPLRRDADPERAWVRLSRRAIPIGAVLLDQSVIAGAGNIFRVEALFELGVSPLRPARELDRAEFDRLWSVLARMLRAGVRAGRIVTTRPTDRPRRRGPLPREDAHYVYRRTGLPCRRCGTPVVTAVIGARHAYWCPACQPG